MHGFIIFLGILFCLWIGRSLFIPLLVATFLWYLINALASYYKKIMPCYKSKNKSCALPSKAFNFISGLLAFGTIAGIIYLFITQIKPMFTEFYINMPLLQQKLLEFNDFLYSTMGLNIDMSLIPNLPQIAGHVGSSIAGLATSTGMVLIYLIFMFIEQSTFSQKLQSLPVTKIKQKKITYILNSIDENMKKYLFMKTFISLATGVSAYLLLKILGLEYVGVWSFIIFILNYIPTIGSIIACGLPIIFALITGNGWHLPIFVAIGLIIIQIIFGNLLDPKLTGKTLNISTLAILINLVLWGMIWGAAGMFFSVPILVGVYVTTAQFESTRWIAVLLSTDGKIPDQTTNN